LGVADGVEDEVDLAEGVDGRRHQGGPLLRVADVGDHGRAGRRVRHQLLQGVGPPR
jgi:hypothetical protein